MAGCRQKRQRGASEKATKLKSPNFVVSTTRLSVRNIPFDMTEAQLRRLAVAAVKERASKEKPEVKQVSKRPLAGGDVRESCVHVHPCHACFHLNCRQQLCLCFYNKQGTFQYLFFFIGSFQYLVFLHWLLLAASHTTEYWGWLRKL